MLQFGSVAVEDFWIKGYRSKYFERRLYPKCECCILTWKKFSDTRNDSLTNHGISSFNGENTNSGNSIVNLSPPQNQSNGCEHTKFLMEKRNEHLVSKEEDDSVQVMSVKQSLLSYKILETLWKLYRNPGETIEEVKQRLVDINDEKFPGSENTEISIKKENYEEMIDIKNESSDDDKEDSEKLEEESACVSENSFYLGDNLTVEIIESNESVQLPKDQESFNIEEECKKNEIFKVPCLCSCSSDSFQSTLNCTYDVPRIEPMTVNAKQIANTFFSSKANEKSVDLKTEIKEEIFDTVEGKVVIGEMCNTQIITPKEIIPENLKISKLSDISSDEEIEFAYKKNAENLIDKGTCSLTKNQYNNKRKRLHYDDFEYSTFHMSSDSEEDINFFDNHRRKLIKLSPMEYEHSKNFLPESIDNLK